MTIVNAKMGSHVAVEFKHDLQHQLLNCHHCAIDISGS
jgi:hypothetical protein